MLRTWILIWCAAQDLESIRTEFVDWFREEGEVEWDEETPEEQLAGVKVILATTTNKGRACFWLSCNDVPAGMRKALDADTSILDYLIGDAITV